MQGVLKTVYKAHLVENQVVLEKRFQYLGLPFCMLAIIAGVEGIQLLRKSNSVYELSGLLLSQAAVHEQS